MGKTRSRHDTKRTLLELGEKPQLRERTTHQMRPNLLHNTSTIHLAFIFRQTFEQGHPRSSVRTSVKLDDWVKHKLDVLLRWNERAESEHDGEKRRSGLLRRGKGERVKQGRKDFVGEECRRKRRIFGLNHPEQVIKEYKTVLSAFVFPNQLAARPLNRNTTRAYLSNSALSPSPFSPQLSSPSPTRTNRLPPKYPLLSSALPP